MVLYTIVETFGTNGASLKDTSPRLPMTQFPTISILDPQTRPGLGWPPRHIIYDHRRPRAHAHSGHNSRCTKHEGNVRYACPSRILARLISTLENTTYVPLLRTCGILTKTEKLAAAWACVVTYDTLAIVLSIINALDRPRHRDADVISYLQGDGAPFFMVCVMPKIELYTSCQSNGATGCIRSVYKSTVRSCIMILTRTWPT